MATKTYKKFLTGAATAAMVASAVAPVAAQGQDVADQASSSFSDIGTSSSHYTNVIEARELGFLSGYTDGTFKPNKDLNRGDVAKMLGKYVVATSGLTLDEYVKAHNIADVENFNDVQDDARDQELVTYSKIVKDAGIFKGSDNNLMATKLMPRDQIAAVLVRAFDLKDEEGTTKVEDGANSGYEKEIEILLENGVSNANPYRPFETTSRAQFASFLVRAYKVSEGLNPGEELPGIESVHDVEDITIKVGETPELPARVGVTYDNGNEGTARVDWDTSNLDNTEEGTYTLTGDVDRTDLEASVNVIVVADDTETPEPGTPELTVDSVQSLNHQLVKVEFTGDASGVKASDFTVDNGLAVLGAVVDGNNNNVVYLTTTSQTAGYEYTLSYEGDEVGTFVFEGTTGVYDENIQITPAGTELLQISTPEANRDANVDRGQRTYTVNVSDLTGTVDIVLAKASDVNPDGTFNHNGNLRAVFSEDLNSFIEEVNGAKVQAGAIHVDKVEIPEDGVITFTVDNTTADEGEVVVPVVFQDTNNDFQLSLDAAGNPTEAVAVGGATGYYTEEAEFGFNGTVTPVGFPFEGAFITDNGTLFNYDDNDNFQVEGVDYDREAFETLLTPGDELEIRYAANAASTFNFVTEVGSEAPDTVSAAAVGNNVHLTWTGGNISNQDTAYTVQRASTVGPDGIAETPDDVVEDFEWVDVTTTTGTSFVDANVADGAYVYRVTVTNPVTEVVSESGEDLADAGVASVSVPGAVAESTPEIVQATVVDNGLRDEVDSGDVWNILFDEPMEIEDGAIIRASETNILGGEYSDIVLGEGNTFTTTTQHGQTLLSITFTEKPAITGYYTFSLDQQRNNVLEYPLAITNTKGIQSADGVEVDTTTATTFGGSADIPNNADQGPTATASDADVDGKSFVLTFNEAIDLESAADKKNYEVRNGDNSVNEVTRVQVTGWNTVTVHTLAPLGNEATVTQEVADVDGNVANQQAIDLTEAAPEAPAPEPVAPTTAGTTLNVENNSVDIAFEQPVALTGNTAALDEAFTFTHAETSTNVVADNVASTDVVAVDANTIRVFFDGDLVEGNHGTVTYADTDEFEITADVENGIELEDGATFTVEDANQPELVENGAEFLSIDTIELSFNEYITGEADETDFTVVSEDGQSAYAVSSAVIGEDTVILTLGTPVDYANETITVSYAEDGGLTDESGNAVVPFDEVVVDETTLLDADEALVAAQERLAQAEADLAEAEAVLEAAQANEATSQEQLEAAQAAVAAAEQAVATAQDQLDNGGPGTYLERQWALQDAQAALVAVQADEDAAQEELDAATAAVAEAQTAVDEAEAVVEAAETAVAEAQAAVDALQ